MKKPLIILNIAAAALLAPIALSFANTQQADPASRPVIETAAARPATAAAPVTDTKAAAGTPSAAACQPAVRVAYAGYGEAARGCADRADITGAKR
ncbi:MAG: hypothetical protein ACRCTD_11695 [Beijerinckiaceae bacterium]